MARIFDKDTSEYLEVDSAPLTAHPFTMACWLYLTDDSIQQTVLWLGDKDVSNNYWELGVMDAFFGTPRAVVAGARNTTIRRAYSSAGVTLNGWSHICGVYTSNVLRAAYMDGANSGIEETNTTPTDADRITIGRLGDSSPDKHFNGSAAEVGVWNAALTGAERAALAAGVSPRAIRPVNLVFYAPLWRDEDEDFVGGLSLTAFNTPTIGTHAPVFYLASAQVGKAPAVGGGVIAQIATVAWAGAGQFAGVAEASIAQVAGVEAN